MRSPVYSGTARRTESKHVENEYFQYLSPESFTILPPEENIIPPNPPRVPEPYKLTPRTKRRKNQAFSIIAEPTSQASSRSGSPTGRVSPFRGRGFNPTGSRHASPERSLQQDSPPDKPRTSSTSRLSQIPKPVRRRSSAEDLLSSDTSPTSQQRPDRRTSNLNGNKYSKSMTNIAPRHLASKPPPSPRRNENLKTSFVRLSPIIGSSPEAGSDQTVSSPSRIPRSKSQPPSRIMSPNPNATPSKSTSRTPSRSVTRPGSRPASRNGSRNASREPSPSSPSKIPLKSSSYKHIPAKVDSFHRTALSTVAKPKVPIKPKVYSTRPSVSDRSSKSSILKKSIKLHVTSSNAFRREAEDTETTDTDRDFVRPGTRNSSQYYSKIQDRSKLESHEKGSTYNYATKRKDIKSKTPGNEKSSSNYGKVKDRSRQDHDKASSSRYSSKESLKYEQNSNDGLAETDDKSTSYYSKNDETNSRFERNTNAEKSSGSLYSKERTRSDESTNKQGRTVYRRDEKNGAKAGKTQGQETTTTISTTEELSRTEDETTEDGKDDDILSVTIDSIIGPSTTQIVSATTETVTKPLNIEAKLIKPSEVAALTQGDTHKPTSVTARIDNANAQKISVGTVNANNTTSNLNITPNVTNSRSPNLSSTPTPTNGSLVNTPKLTSANVGTGISATNEQNTLNVNPTVPNVTTAENNKQKVIESANNNVKRVTHADTQNLSNLEMNVRNSLNSLTPTDSDKVAKSLLESPRLNNTTNDKLKQARTVIVDEVKPIKITVREKTSDMEVQSGNFVLPRSATNGLAERPLVPPNNVQQNSTEQPNSETKKPNPCTRFLGCCKKTKNTNGDEPIIRDQEAQNTEENVKPTFWSKLRCKKNKVSDSSEPNGCFQKFRRNKQTDENWAERRDSILSEPPKKQSCCGRLNRIFSVSCCSKCRRKPVAESVSRRTSMMSKKKSLSSTMQPPPEDTRSKIDVSLVEYSSLMRGAIPVLPVPLAWICLICNVFLPGFGTILSGLLCLCIGKPRFSPKDGAKPRIGAFLIDVIVGISQMFTVLFCLVGWGWSIWWGVIMLKIARKQKKIKLAERSQIEEQPAPNVNHLAGDVERAS